MLSQLSPMAHCPYNVDLMSFLLRKLLPDFNGANMRQYQHTPKKNLKMLFFNFFFDTGNRLSIIITKKKGNTFTHYFT